MFVDTHRSLLRWRRGGQLSNDDDGELSVFLDRGLKGPTNKVDEERTALVEDAVGTREDCGPRRRHAPASPARRGS